MVPEREPIQQSSRILHLQSRQRQKQSKSLATTGMKQLMSGVQIKPR